jgi:hypothetical protein
MRRAFAILLTVTILACPQLCTLGECCLDTNNESGAGGCSCCHEGEAESSGDEHSLPVDSRLPDSGHSCTCICGGAVLDDAGLHVVQFDWTWSLPVVVSEPAIGPLHDTLDCQNSLAPWPDVGMNAGRAICCLCSTYQC